MGPVEATRRRRGASRGDLGHFGSSDWCHGRLRRSTARNLDEAPSRSGSRGGIPPQPEARLILRETQEIIGVDSLGRNCGARNLCEVFGMVGGDPAWFTSTFARYTAAIGGGVPPADAAPDHDDAGAPAAYDAGTHDAVPPEPDAAGKPPAPGGGADASVPLPPAPDAAGPVAMTTFHHAGCSCDLGARRRRPVPLASLLLIALSAFRLRRRPQPAG